MSTLEAAEFTIVQQENEVRHVTRVVCRGGGDTATPAVRRSPSRFGASASVHRFAFAARAATFALILIAGISANAGTTVAATASAKRYDGTLYRQVLPQSLAVLRRGAKRSREIREWQGIRREISFPTQIQHVVVIDMENRTVDNLFAAYWGHQWKNGPNMWQNVMNIANPAGPPKLTPNPLATSAAFSFDPAHEHDIGFLSESLNGFGAESFDCAQMPCPANATAYSFVPLPEADPYAQLMQNYASADEVFQGNQGPSMPAHQYLIAGQSGGVPGSLTWPLAIASNPGNVDVAKGASGRDSIATVEADGGTAPAYCAGGKQLGAPSVDMTGKEPEPTASNAPIDPPCEKYANGTILDKIAASEGAPSFADWQYIAHQAGGFWAAPMAVANLYAAYAQGNVSQQPFATDPNAYNFVQNLKGSGNPKRPFAALTYITPCPNASDHPNSMGGVDYGPQWLGTLINAIGTAQNGAYWPSTAIIVMWDDWGGFYDHVPWPEATKNANNNSSDPNEWGYRVPFLVISPYLTYAGYVSHGQNGTLTKPVPRSQSAALKFVETVFDLPSLDADDAYANDDLLDMFNFQNYLPFKPVTGLGNYTIPSVC